MLKHNATAVVEQTPILQSLTPRLENKVFFLQAGIKKICKIFFRSGRPTRALKKLKNFFLGWLAKASKQAVKTIFQFFF
jgi:hypothetical protein